MVYTSASHLYGPINMSLDSQKGFCSVRIRRQPFKKDWHSIKVHSGDSEGLEWTHVVPINGRTKKCRFLDLFAAAMERAENDVAYRAQTTGINKHGWLWNRLRGINEMSPLSD